MRWWWHGLSTAFCLSTFVGCADGPIPYMMAMNPSMRRQWEADEAYQPTLHRQLAEVEALRAQAPRLSEEQQRHWSGELTHILQSHANPLLRAASVDTLAELTVPESNEGLRLAMKDADATVRIAACRAWGSRGGQQGLELLADVLGSDTEMDVRLAAARELGRFADPVAYQALGLALQTDNAALQYRAVESLKAASGRNYGNDFRAWQEFAEGKDPGPEYTPSLAERVKQLF
ncbi:MAG: HEAT repeat domain-containing protein [Pirellulaceae bacterium]|jgi:hypothetical protein|nr:HEAT repeat domain-containing protein [Pirellulaceae bacterium]